MNLSDFIRQGWDALKFAPGYQHNWHIDAIASHLEAVSKGEISRLQIWAPPASSKTSIVSVFWPAWEWTWLPETRWITATYDRQVAKQNALRSHELMSSDWYRERWGDVFSLKPDTGRYVRNDKGGFRSSTSPYSANTGATAHRIVLDDPFPCYYETDYRIVNDWYDGSLATHGIIDHVRVIVMSRFGSDDLAAHALEQEAWEVLCLPERYEPDHPFAWPGDPRKDGDLLWPDRRTAEDHEMTARKLGKERASSWLQQNPLSTTSRA